MLIYETSLSVKKEKSRKSERLAGRPARGEELKRRKRQRKNKKKKKKKKRSNDEIIDWGFLSRIRPDRCHPHGRPYAEILWLLIGVQDVLLLPWILLVQDRSPFDCDAN